MPGRRFDDSLPPLDPISDSSWDRLSHDERADLLRQREAVMLARHQQLMAGQREGRDRIGAVEGTIAALIKRVDIDLAPMLQKNTEATTRTEEKVDGVVANTASLLKLWGELQGASSLASRFGSLVKDLAWIVVPGGAIVLAWHAALDWLKTIKGGG